MLVSTLIAEQENIMRQFEQVALDLPATSPKFTARCFGLHENVLYCGCSRDGGALIAESYNGTNWSWFVGVDASPPPWTADEIKAIASWNGSLVVAACGELWAYRPWAWNRINLGPQPQLDQPQPEVVDIGSLLVLDGDLIVAVTVQIGDDTHAVIYRLSTDCAHVASHHFYHEKYPCDLVLHRGNLYTATSGMGAAVWKISPDFSSVVKVGRNGLGSFENAGIHTLHSDGEDLLIGTVQISADTPEGCPQAYGNGWGGEVWHYLGGAVHQWEPVIEPGFGNPKNGTVYDIESGGRGTIFVSFDNNHPAEGLHIFELSRTERGGYRAELAVPLGLGQWIRSAHRMLEQEADGWVYCACDGPDPHECGTIWRIRSYTSASSSDASLSINA